MSEFLYYEDGEPVYADDKREREIAELRAEVNQLNAELEKPLMRELKRFREREPLVQRVIELGKLVEYEDGWWKSLREAVEKLADAPCITGGSASDASAADPTGGEPKEPA